MGSADTAGTGAAATGISGVARGDTEAGGDDRGSCDTTGPGVGSNVAGLPASTGSDAGTVGAAAGCSGPFHDANPGAFTAPRSVSSCNKLANPRPSAGFDIRGANRSTCRVQLQPVSLKPRRFFDLASPAKVAGFDPVRLCWITTGTCGSGPWRKGAPRPSVHAVHAVHIGRGRSRTDGFPTGKDRPPKGAASPRP